MSDGCFTEQEVYRLRFGHPNQMPKPSQLTPFNAEEQRLYSELPPDV